MLFGIVSSPANRFGSPKRPMPNADNSHCPLPNADLVKTLGEGVRGRRHPSPAG